MGCWSRSQTGMNGCRSRRRWGSGDTECRQALKMLALKGRRGIGWCCRRPALRGYLFLFLNSFFYSHSTQEVSTVGGLQPRVSPCVPLCHVDKGTCFFHRMDSYCTPYSVACVFVSLSQAVTLGLHSSRSVAAVECSIVQMDHNLYNFSLIDGH